MPSPHGIFVCTMRQKSSKQSLFAKLSILYGEMAAAYNDVASQLELSCTGCPHNCCTSYFLHHTHIEWAYLWDGLNRCDNEKRKGFVQNAADYVRRAGPLLAKGIPPKIMCPLNEDGRCQLYDHRLMICRMHGVPSSFIGPDGQKRSFPGCKTCQALYAGLSTVPVLDRTDFYQRLAELERQWVQGASQPLPRVKLTLAEMVANGPPEA